MQIDNKTIINILLNGSYVTQENIDTAQKKLHGDKDSIADILIRDQVISGDILGQAIAEHLGIKYADLNTHIPPLDQIKKIPAKFANKLRIVFFSFTADTIVIATDNPTTKGLAEWVKQLFPKYNIEIRYSLTQDIDSILSQYQQALATRFADIIKSESHVAPNIIEEIISDAVSFSASDVHFEPHATEVIIRFRVDGVLQEAGRIPKQFYESIINRVKVQSHLRIDEHNTAQDGSIRFSIKDSTVDVRISILPTLEGEKIVMRVLARYVKQLTFSDLGLTAEQEEQFKAASHKPFGMILVVGPTGSGKTTTLYSLIKILNAVDVNITTIEDPVEYRMEGVNQTQVHEETKLTFARGLRSIVRQDPDIILVGEIRDEETADIATNAALTGHLLFSTFHANNSTATIPRLIDMGIEPFLLASTLELVVSQRLLRKICDNCKYSTAIKVDELRKSHPDFANSLSQKTITLYKGKGCQVCHSTGYKGRTAVFEMLSMSPEVRDLIHSSPSDVELSKIARHNGMKTMYEDGLEKVKSGVTSLEELARVLEPPVSLDTESNEVQNTTEKKGK